MERDPLVNLKGMSPDEYAYLRQILTEMNERQSQNFVAFYSNRRKDPQEILLFTLNIKYFLFLPSPLVLL